MLLYKKTNFEPDYADMLQHIIIKIINYVYLVGAIQLFCSPLSSESMTGTALMILDRDKSPNITSMYACHIVIIQKIMTGLFECEYI